MDMHFTPADWIVVGTFVVGAVATVIGVWLQNRKPEDGADDAGETPAPARRRGGVTVALAEEDRSFLHQVAHDLRQTFGGHRDAMEDHRRAIEDQTAELRRQRES